MLSRSVKREVSGWMRCFTRDLSEARGQQPLTPLVCPSLNVLEAHPRQRSDRAHKSRRPSRSPRESPRAQLRNELPSKYKYEYLHHPHTTRDVKGTDKQADHRISTPGIIQAVHGTSDLPVWAWGAASTLPPAPQSAQWMLQRGHRRARPARNLPPKSAVEKTAEVASSTSGKIFLRRKRQNHHRREADVEVSTAHPVASRTETIRRIGGPSKCCRKRGSST